MLRPVARSTCRRSSASNSGSRFHRETVYGCTPSSPATSATPRPDRSSRAAIICRGVTPGRGGFVLHIVRVCCAVLRPVAPLGRTGGGVAGERGFGEVVAVGEDAASVSGICRNAARAAARIAEAPLGRTGLVDIRTPCRPRRRMVPSRNNPRPYQTFTILAMRSSTGVDAAA